HTAAIVNGDGRTAVQKAVHQHLIVRGHGRDHPRFDDAAGGATIRQARGELDDWPENTTDPEEGMAERYGQHRGTVLLIEYVRIVRVNFGAPGSTAGDERGRQHLANEPICNEPPEVIELGLDAGLTAADTEKPLCPGQLGHLPRLGETIAERPFAINMFAGLE